MKDNKHAISRRDFIKGAAAGAVGMATMGILGACSNNSSETTAAAQGTASETSAAVTTGMTETTAAAAEIPVVTDTEHMTAEKARQPWAFEIAPVPITDADIAEVLEADIIVVGAGTAGLVTANSAADEGVDVILISASEGPSSRGGSNNTIYCKAMEEAGVPRVSPWDFEKEIFCNTNKVDQAKWFKHYNNSETAANWAIDLMEEVGYGVTVEYGTPMEEGNLYSQATAAIGWELGEGMEAPEGMVVMTGMMQPLFVNRLAERLTDTGARIDYKTPARQLVRDDNNIGRVTAVIAQREDGKYVKYIGKKAIVLATGDFSADRDMMQKYCPDTVNFVDENVYNGEAAYDIGFQYGGLMKGDGQKMGLWVGAAWQNTFPNCSMVYSSLPGPSLLYGIHWGILLNQDGERFMNEYCLGPMAGMSAAASAGKTFYAIWDKGYASHTRTTGSWNNDSAYSGDYSIISDEEVTATIAAWDESAEKGEYVKADTLEELIELLGLPDSAITTIKHYNEMAQKKEDTEFYKSPNFLFEIKDGPFYGQKSSLNFGFLCVLGGLRTNVNMQVCDAEDNAIPGLYNVGTMVGDVFAGTYTFQVEGANYGMNCLTFGYLTGKYIAENE